MDGKKAAQLWLRVVFLKKHIVDDESAATRKQAGGFTDEGCILLWSFHVNYVGYEHELSGFLQDGDTRVEGEQIARCEFDAAPETTSLDKVLRHEQRYWQVD